MYAILILMMSEKEFELIAEAREKENIVRINEAASEKGGLQKSGLKKKTSCMLTGGLKSSRPTEETSSVDAMVRWRRGGSFHRTRVGILVVESECN